MWLRRPLDDILASGAKVAVLRAICDVNAPLSGREIARRAGISSGRASKVLRELSASGALLARDHGRANTYELADPNLPLVRALRELFGDEHARQESIAGDLVAGVPGVLAVVLFGSEARGEARPGSDTDLLVVVDVASSHVEDLLVDRAIEVGRRHQIALSWHVVDLDQLRSWDDADHPLWLNVRADGILLRGLSIERLERRWRSGRTG